ncbi:MAG: spiro-SPASM protein [Spirochaetes bacterium]|nr:spiro-SPASM protein [Spirochaetota bacterium]
MKIGAIVLFPKSIKKEELFFRGTYIPEDILLKLKRISKVREVFMVVGNDYDGEVPVGSVKIVGSEEGEMLFLKKFFRNSDFDHALVVHADSPFLDSEILHEMLQLHTTYLPEYTYSENVPPGFCGEIVSKTLMESVPDEVQPSISISSLIKANLHKFDVEIYYSHPDIRDRRVSFRSSDPRDRRIMERIVEFYGRIPRYKDIGEVFRQFPQVLYVSPSYVEVELTGKCELECIFCFRKSFSAEHGNMDPSIFQKILQDMRYFQLPYHICIGGSGEPLLHPQFYELMEMALAEESVATVIIETNGVLADANFAHFISRAKERIRVIVNLNGIDEKTYLSLHGKDYFSKVASNVELLRNTILEPECLYVQIMKINETEKFLDAYYDMWEQKGVPIILQKQNTFLGRIQDRRYSDLSPIERIPCWHLQRDLYILYDGKVSFCKQDVEGKFNRGNVKEVSLKEIFENGMSHFVENFKGNLSKNPDCAICDEWYTFNL